MNKGLDGGKDLHARLASENVRVFKIVLYINGHTEENFLIHPNKTTAQFRKDFSAFYQHDMAGAPFDGKSLLPDDAASVLYNKMMNHMNGLGYVEIDDVVDDVFEGAFTNEKSRIVDDLNHEEQPNGFGHYGWGSKNVADD